MSKKDDGPTGFIKDLLAKLIGDNPSDMFITGALAYIGYDKLTKEGIEPAIALMVGPLGYKLAISPASGGEVGFEIFGTGFKLPINSQVAGLMMLGYLGFKCFPWGEQKFSAQSDVFLGLRERIDNYISMNTAVLLLFAYINGQPPINTRDITIRDFRAELVKLKSDLDNAYAASFAGFWGQVKTVDMEAFNVRFNEIISALEVAYAKYVELHPIIR